MPPLDPLDPEGDTKLKIDFQESSKVETAVYKHDITRQCSALWGERERVVWSIFVAQAVKYPAFQSQIKCS